MQDEVRRRVSKTRRGAVRNVFATVVFAATIAAPLRAQAPGTVPPFTSALAVATFDTAWTLIARAHYDSLFNGVDWDAVRAELRPRAAAAANPDELRAVIGTMLGRLGESHHVLIPHDVADAIEPGEAAGSSGDRGDVGVEARLADGQLVVWRLAPDGPAAAAGVHTGWILESIDGKPAAAGLEALATLDGFERQLALTRFLMTVAQRLAGPAGSEVPLVLRDGAGKTVSVRLTRRASPGQPVRLGNLPTMLSTVESQRREIGGACVGVIRWNVWMVPLKPRIDRAVDESRDCRGIVLDLRGNPGGVAGMLMGVAGHFFAEPQSLGTLTARTGVLRFVANPQRVGPDGQPVQPFDGPVAILLDPISVSTSEMFAIGMQSVGRARVFGETSAGQALPAVATRLPNQDVLMYVVADAQGPGGERVEGVGVVPDQPVPLRRDDLLAGRDAAMDAAIAWILSQRSRT